MNKTTIPIPGFTSLQSENFWAKVQPTGFCWDWTAGKTHDGYGKFNVGPKMVLAHRATYTMLVGKIPDGLELDHLCRNRHCVNPDHLDPVTTAENNLRIPRALELGATFLPPWVQSGKNVTGLCVKGHQYTELNTYTYKDGRTECRTCKKANAAAYRARKKQIA
jgi:hypothetical protein